MRSSNQPESAAAWQLIRNDVFADRILDDGELTQLVADRAKISLEPHADILRLMVGMSMTEVDARSLFARVLDHRHAMSHALNRPVHIRVAALDLLTSTPPSPPSSPATENKKKNPRDSRPIMVAADMLERALEEAGSDGVTGLPRGPLFTNLLQHELRQRRRRVVVVYIDLDGFKNVNDQHGHARGDEVLRTMAQAAHSVLRHGDVLARIGGDEFALMLVDVSPEEAEVAVDRLRSRFEALTAPLATSFSAGIAAFDRGAGNATGTSVAGREEAITEELLARADRAMYEDKRARSSNRLRVAPPQQQR